MPSTLPPMLNLRLHPTEPLEPVKRHGRSRRLFGASTPSSNKLWDPSSAVHLQVRTTDQHCVNTCLSDHSCTATDKTCLCDLQVSNQISLCLSAQCASQDPQDFAAWVQALCGTHSSQSSTTSTSAGPSGSKGSHGSATDTGSTSTRTSRSSSDSTTTSIPVTVGINSTFVSLQSTSTSRTSLNSATSLISPNSTTLSNTTIISLPTSSSTDISSTLIISSGIESDSPNSTKTPSTSRLPLNEVIAIALGVLGAVTIIALLIWWCFSRRSRKRDRRDYRDVGLSKYTGSSSSLEKILGDPSPQESVLHFPSPVQTAQTVQTTHISWLPATPKTIVPEDSISTFAGQRRAVSGFSTLLPSATMPRFTVHTAFSTNPSYAVPPCTPQTLLTSALSRQSSSGSVCRTNETASTIITPKSRYHPEPVEDALRSARVPLTMSPVKYKRVSHLERRLSFPVTTVGENFEEVGAAWEQLTQPNNINGKSMFQTMLSQFAEKDSQETGQYSDDDEGDDAEKVSNLNDDEGEAAPTRASSLDLAWVTELYPNSTQSTTKRRITNPRKRRPSQRRSSWNPRSSTILMPKSPKSPKSPTRILAAANKKFSSRPTIANGNKHWTEASLSPLPTSPIEEAATQHRFGNSTTSAIAEYASKQIFRRSSMKSAKVILASAKADRVATVESM